MFFDGLQVRSRRWALLAAVGLIALFTMAHTFDCRDAAQRPTREFTVWHCDLICFPYIVKVSGSFFTEGHGHWNHFTNDISSHLHESEQRLVIENFYNDGAPRFPFGLNLSMSIEVYSNTAGDLGVLSMEDGCAPAIYPGEWLRWCLGFDGTVQLGPEGGDGSVNWGAAATGTVICPCHDAFSSPWFQKV